MALLIEDGQTIEFIGDSITDCGRRAAERPLGNGYVKLFSDFVTIREPEKQLTIINRGIGGDRVTGLRNRWADDVIRNRPDWLSVKIGINDLHSHLRQAPEAVCPELFREAYDDILGRTRDELPDCELLLVDPFYISREASAQSFRKRVLDAMPLYLDTVHEMSEKYGARLVRTHDIFQRLIECHDPNEFCPEPVHPYLIGHLVIAEAVYAVLSE